MFRIALLLAALGSLARPMIAADGPAGALASTLTPEEFSQAGLPKLSPGELAALEAALLRHQLLARPATALRGPTPIPATAPKAAAAFGAEEVAMAAKPAADTPAALHTRIEGTLDGFSGRAVFVMENGQIWQLRMPQTVNFVRKLTNPDLRLRLLCR